MTSLSVVSFNNSQAKDGTKGSYQEKLGYTQEITYLPMFVFCMSKCLKDVSKCSQ